MADLHSLAGRTMSAGEAALRAKMTALADILDGRHDLGSGNAAQCIRDVLSGEYDPRDIEL